jgi:hypothetical protein
VTTLASPGVAAQLVARLRAVRPDSPRRWGRMTPPQMICHLRDAFVMGTGGKPVSEARGLHNRTVVKWIALYAPVRWPAGIMTRPEIDQAVGGTPPRDFDADRQELIDILDRLVSDPGAFFAGRRHPIFGRLSLAAWLRWSYLHVDHHLRQFGA